MHRTRNAAYGQPYRELESPPLRHQSKGTRSDVALETGLSEVPRGRSDSLLNDNDESKLATLPVESCRSPQLEDQKPEYPGGTAGSDFGRLCMWKTDQIPRLRAPVQAYSACFKMTEGSCTAAYDYCMSLLHC